MDTSMKMPSLKPIRIPTKDKGFFGAIWLWLWVNRKWELTEDWEYSLEGKKYRVPKGFVFDGASVPKYFQSWLSPMGILLLAGLIHDYGYKYAGLLSDSGELESKTQKELDIIFREVAIETNGFFFLNWIAYLALRIFGWFVWNKHRRREALDK